jgi:hypothetical protein
VAAASTVAAALRMGEAATRVLLRAAEAIAATALLDRLRSNLRYIFISSLRSRQLRPGLLQVLKKLLVGVPFFRRMGLLKKILQLRVVSERHS